MSNIILLRGNKEPLETLVEDYRILDRQAKQLRLEADCLKAKIIQTMSVAKMEAVPNRTGDIIATYTSHVREEFDARRLKKEIESIYEVYVRFNTHYTFRLK